MVDIPATSKPASSLGKKIKRYLIITAILAVVIFGSIFAIATFGYYSDGFRVGNVIKMSHKGFAFKTWEGQLDQGYITQEPGGINTRIWNFSVHNKDENVRRLIEKAITENKKVKLYYKEKFMDVFFLGETRYFVYSVQEVR
ncbi:MAG: hypothetical protein J0L94_07080 [Rhodothermia bacterium]|nr:hypothetical protein [Rhodothermia bacterium]